MANDDPPSSSEDHHSISEEYNSDTKGYSSKSKAVYYGNSLLENLDMTAGNYRDKLHTKESQILDADDDDLVGVESDLDKLSQELNARAPIEEIHEESIEHKEQSSINDTSLFTDKDEIEMLENKKCYKLRRFYTVIKVSISGTCFKIINSPIFEGVSLAIIVLNSIFMAMEDPTDESSNSDFEVLDNVFLALYTIEMVLKILGQGFIFPRKSYLRESWNILDFIIVISGYLPMFLSSNSTNLNVLRSFRVLRPLRTISGIEGLKILVSALLSAIPMLRDTILVLLFFFLIFAIAGLQLWSGVLKKRCIEIETGKVHPDNL